MSIPLFTLRFDLAEVHALASWYEYPDGDRKVMRIGEKAGERGYFTKPEFLEVCEWKTKRSKSRVKKNHAEEIREATQIALASKSEELRIWSPMALYGVSWATSSVLLHLAHRDPYPILDFRALESLGIPRTVVPTMEFWKAYVNKFRELQTLSGTDPRTLDRALWQWSKERGQAMVSGSGT